jgi:type IV pilus assembly protein PilA
MINKLRVRAASESGFTLVELLVVMLILGLLAAIAIPSFFNQRDKAKDADAKEAVRTAQTAMETWATDHGGVYNDPAAPTATDLQAIETSLNDANLAPAPTATATGYTVTATADDTGNTFSITRNTDGTLDSDCTTHGEGGCPSNGKWAADDGS